MQDAYVSSSDIPGAKTRLTDFFKSKSKATIVVPEKLVASSSIRSPVSGVTSSPKKIHTAALPITSLGISSHTSQQEDTTEDYQIIDPSADLEEMPGTTHTAHTSVTQSLHSHQTRKTDHEDSQGEQDSQNAYHSLNIGHSPSSDLRIESRVQISTGDPDNPLAFGVIRWIGEVKNHGRTAGVEMVNLSSKNNCTE